MSWFIAKIFLTIITRATGLWAGQKQQQQQQLSFRMTEIYEQWKMSQSLAAASYYSQIIGLRRRTTKLAQCCRDYFCVSLKRATTTPCIMAFIGFQQPKKKCASVQFDSGLSFWEALPGTQHRIIAPFYCSADNLREMLPNKLLSIAQWWSGAEKYSAYLGRGPVYGWWGTSAIYWIGWTHCPPTRQPLCGVTNATLPWLVMWNAETARYHDYFIMYENRNYKKFIQKWHHQI